VPSLFAALRIVGLGILHPPKRMRTVPHTRIKSFAFRKITLDLCLVAKMAAKLIGEITKRTIFHCFVPLHKAMAGANCESTIRLMSNSLSAVKKKPRNLKTKRVPGY